MTVVKWLGWLIILLSSAVAGIIIGALAGMLAGPTKVVTWLNEKVRVTETNDSI
jgi:ABC-type microcin C transport system permease subunit YejE